MLKNVMSKLLTYFSGKMKKVDYIIIGSGLAGISFCEQL